MLTISARACFTQVSLPFLQVIPLKGGGRCLFVIAEIFALQLEAFWSEQGGSLGKAVRFPCYYAIIIAKLL